MSWWSGSSGQWWTDRRYQDGYWDGRDCGWDDGSWGSHGWALGEEEGGAGETAHKRRRSAPHKGGKSPGEGGWRHKPHDPHLLMQVMLP